jgi:hypothetical protein
MALWSKLPKPDRGHCFVIHEHGGVERGMRNVSLVNIGEDCEGLRKSLPELFSRV